MGIIYSRVKVLQIAVKQVLEISKSYEKLRKRIELSPGLPVQNPTLSFWMDVPSPIASYRPDTLPGYADVVIIGSGITGTSIARTLLAESKHDPVKVVMLEARDACSGATGRNGGHIKPPLHHDYTSMKKKIGLEQVKKLINLRLSHLREMKDVAKFEGIVKECQCREVESLDVYFGVEEFERAKELLKEWKEDMPDESRDYFHLEKEEANERFHLSPDIAGVIYNEAGAIHPYRFVTNILSRLLRNHKKTFTLATQTPCTSIRPPSRSVPFYTVTTPRGNILTPHVVHATNAWSSHLLEPMRGKIMCVRGNMTAQRPGSSLSPSTLDGGRSWVFYDLHKGYDYLTQLPNGEKELMFGGGFFQGGDDYLSELGNCDDSSFNSGIAAHLAGSLPILFGGRNWGSESPALDSSRNESGEDGDEDGVKEVEGKWFEGRVKALWSGIIGISADRIPWVGRVPPKVAGREAPPSTSTPESTLFATNPIQKEWNGGSTGDEEILISHEKSIVRSSKGYKTAAPGEWISAGYSGEGMAHAFMCGQALAYMLLGMEESDKRGSLSDWFPEALLVTEERWRKARAEDLIEELWG